MTLGNMRTLSLAAIINLIPCAGAMAAVLTFACSGTMRTLEGRRQEIPWMFALTLDSEKMTLVLDDYDNLPLTPTITSPKINMNFGLGASLPDEKDGPTSARFNRITGEATVHSHSGGQKMMLKGVCKPQKLF